MREQRRLRFCGWPLAGAIFAGWLIVIAVAFSRTTCTFLRAESGWYELLANSNAVTRADFLHGLFSHSYVGHYAPFAFLAEFELTRWIGPVERFWHWRQLVALSGVAVTLFALVCAVARVHRVRWLHSVPAAVGITSLFVFQPLMRELLSWPFMVMQIGWIFCSLIAVTSLVQLVLDPGRERWLWLAVGFGYGSMHLLGLGIITALSVWTILLLLLAGIFAKKLPQFNRLRSRLFLALALLTILTLAHALCMSLLLPPGQLGANTPAPPPFSIASELGFVASFCFAVLLAVVQPGAETSVGSYFVRALAPCGLLLLVGALLVAVQVTRRAWQRRSAARVTTALLHVFAFTMFFGLLLLMAVRRSHDPAISNMTALLMGARYLVPASFAFAISLVAVVVPMMHRARQLGAIFFIIVALAAVVTQCCFVPRVFRQLHPLSTISHAKTWSAIVSMANECHASNVPIPNVPLGALVQEFSTWDLQLFEPFLRSQMHLPEEERLSFAPWEKVQSSLPEYEHSAPSLRKVIERIKTPAH